MTYPVNKIDKLLLISVVIILKTSSADGLSNESFPANFIFGVATSAYQVEGGWDSDGKGESAWDYISHNYNSHIADRSNGDIACDSYHKIDEDIAMLKNLGVNFYRFSISWSRIVPNGNVSEGVNQPGVTYYQTLLSKLEAAKIDAMVTLFHFDLPQTLYKRHLFLHEDLNSLFVDFARLAFRLFGSKVKYWVTFNEPRGSCNLLEKRSLDRGRDVYTCAHNIIKSHAMVYRMYDEEFRDRQKGQISIVVDTIWDEPATQNIKDVEAAERKLLFEFGWFAHPIIFGDYPDVMKKRIRSYTLPFLPSRLPEFTDEEKKLIMGTTDFIGLNHYTTSLVTDKPNEDFFRTYVKDMGILMTCDPSWETMSAEGMYVVPFGMRKILNWVYNTYNMSIIITENGYVEDGTVGLEDDRRINYYQTYFSNILDAIYIDKVNVIGYSSWSLMDNWEWTSGYTQKFGLYSVNFSDPNRERTPKKSVDYFKKVLETRRVL